MPPLHVLAGFRQAHTQRNFTQTKSQHARRRGRGLSSRDQHEVNELEFTIALTGACAHAGSPPRGLSIPNTSRHSITCAVPLRVTKPAGIWRGLPNPRTNRHSTTRSPIITLGAATAASPALIALCMERYLVSCQIPRANQPDENPPVNMGQPDGQPLDIMSCNLTTT